MKVITVNDIKIYYNTTKKIPVISEDNDKYTNILGGVLNSYRKNVNNSKEIDLILPEYWKKISKCKLHNNVISMIDFYKKHDRMPIQIRHVNKSRTPEEKQEYKLACWLNSQKQKNDSSNNNRILEMLNDEIPNWNDKLDHEQNAINQAHKIVDFWNKYNRLPKQSSKSNETEYKLSTWLNSQKLSIKGKNSIYIYPDVIDILDTIPNIWKNCRNNE